MSRDHNLEEFFINKYFVKASSNVLNEAYAKMSDVEKNGAIQVVSKALQSMKQSDPYLYEYMINWVSNRPLEKSMVSENDPNCETFQTNGPLLTWNPAFVKEDLKYNFNYVCSVLVHEALSS